MTLNSVYLIKVRATPFLVFFTLCSSIGWVSSRRQSNPFGMDGPMEPLFDVPSAGFDPRSSMYSEPIVPMYPPKSSGNRSPFGESPPRFGAPHRPPFGGNRSPFGDLPSSSPFGNLPSSPFGNLPSSSSPFGNLPSSSSPFGGGPDMSPPWERSFNSMPGGGAPSPFNARPRIGISSFGASPKLNGGYTPPWQRDSSSRQSPAAFPIESGLMGIDDMGPALGRRHRRIKPEKPDLFARARMGGGDPEEFGMESFRDDEAMSYGNPFPMMELPGYEEMLMGGRGMVPNTGRRTSGFDGDLGGAYVEDADEPPSYGDSIPYGNPAAGGGGGKRGDKKRHRPRTQKYPPVEEYTGSGMSYGPYGYQDPDFDESLIEELEMVDQQPDQTEMEEAGPNDQLYATMDENNAKQFNQPIRNGGHGSKGGEKSVKPTKKPQTQPVSADALEEEVVFGNVRRSVETPQDILNKIRNNEAAANGNSSGRGPSEVINGLRSSPPLKNKGFVRGGGGGGRMHYNGNMNQAGAQQPMFRVGGRHPQMSASEEEENVIRGTFPSPGQLAPGSNLYPGLDGYVMEPQMNRGMYPMNELNRRRRNAMAENYYGDTEAYPILRPLPVPITPKYLYGDQPLYTYDVPSLVFNRMKRQGGPQQYLVNPRSPGGVPGQGPPRRLIRRIIRRRPLIQRQRRLRQQLLPQEILTDEEEGSYENTGEMEGVTPVIPQTNDNANNTNSTGTITTTTIITTSVPTTTTEVPHENVANPKPEATETKPVKSDHKRKRETNLYN